VCSSDLNLASFCRLFSDKVDRAFLVSLSPETIKLDKKITSIPLNRFIYEMDLWPH
jgi:hypothetical protein